VVLLVIATVIATLLLAALSVQTVKTQHRLSESFELELKHASHYTTALLLYKTTYELRDSHEFTELKQELKASASYLAGLTPLSLTRGRFVCRAIDQRSGAPLVVKTLVGDASTGISSLHGLYNEAFILNILSGKRSPKLIAAITAETGRPFMIREFKSGVSLDRVLIKCAMNELKPKYSEIRELLNSTSMAVASIHRSGVVHGDLKPANLVAEWKTGVGDDLTLAPMNDVSILDFESAVVMEPEGSPHRTSQRGTPYFMAPERYAQAPVGPQSDVYSISALTALLFTGRPIRPGQSAGSRIKSIPLRNAIRRGLSVLINERIQTIEQWQLEVIAAIDELIHSDGDMVVDWPVSMQSFAHEIANQTATIDLRHSVQNRYPSLVSLLSLKSVVGGELDDATRVRNSRELLDATYGAYAEQSGSDFDRSLPLDRLRRRLEEAVSTLDENYRELSNSEVSPA
jgi:serine/threonine protein kinase